MMNIDTAERLQQECGAICEVSKTELFESGFLNRNQDRPHQYIIPSYTHMTAHKVEKIPAHNQRVPGVSNSIDTELRSK